jgi:hypothetical protein
VLRNGKKTFFLKFILRLVDGSKGATRRNLQTRPKILKKNIGTPNQPIRIKIFPKKVCLVPKNCKGAKTTCRNLPPSFKNNWLNSKSLNLIKRICCYECTSSFDDNNMIKICQKDTKAIRAMLLENITKPNGKRF